MLFKGSGVAIVTPFTNTGDIDFEALGELIEFQIKEGIDAIISIGTTGEAATLSIDEKLEIINFTIDKVNRRVPIIVGTGSNNTKDAVSFSKEVSELDIDGLLVVSPFYNKGTDTGLIEHFTEIANVSKVPVMLYSVPGRTGHNIPLNVVVELSKHKNICGIKDASGDLSYTMNIRNNTPDEFQIISGNDDLTVPMLAVGAEGVISVVANVFPKETSEMVHSFLNGDSKKSKELQLKLLPFIEAAFSEVSPVPIKYATHLLGFGTPELRLPLTVAEENVQQSIRQTLKNLNRL